MYFTALRNGLGTTFFASVFSDIMARAESLPFHRPDDPPARENIARHGITAADPHDPPERHSPGPPPCRRRNPRRLRRFRLRPRLPQRELHPPADHAPGDVRLRPFVP